MRDGSRQVLAPRKRHWRNSGIGVAGRRMERTRAREARFTLLLAMVCGRECGASFKNLGVGHETICGGTFLLFFFCELAAGRAGSDSASSGSARRGRRTGDSRRAFERLEPIAWAEVPAVVEDAVCRQVDLAMHTDQLAVAIENPKEAEVAVEV